MNSRFVWSCWVHKWEIRLTFGHIAEQTWASKILQISHNLLEPINLVRGWLVLGQIYGWKFKYHLMWISVGTQRRDSGWWENRTQKQKLAWHKSFPAVNLVLKLLSESINTACVYTVCFSMRQYCSQSMWILLSTQKIDSECWENGLNNRKICLNTQKIPSSLV